MHSTWSDGRDSIEAMVEACRALGYEYMAITDHSPHSAAARNLTVDGVKKQADEIAALRERYPRHRDSARLRSRHPAGRPPRFSRSGARTASTSCSRRCTSAPATIAEQLLKRYAAAMHHPLVTLITHPTNRLVPHAARLRSRLRPPVRARRRNRHDASKSTARRRTSTWTARSPAAPSPPASTVAIDSDCHRCGNARPADGARHRHGPPRLGRGAARAEHASARRGPRGRSPPSAPAAERRCHDAPRAWLAARPPRRRRRRGVRALPRDPAAGRRLRRHRLVPDDGRDRR